MIQTWRWTFKENYKYGLFKDEKNSKMRPAKQCARTFIIQVIISFLQNTARMITARIINKLLYLVDLKMLMEKNIENKLSEKNLLRKDLSLSFIMGF